MLYITVVIFLQHMQEDQGADTCGGHCAVTVNGERLTMTKGETELEMIPYVEGGELVIVWQKHREGLGNAVEITTGVPPTSSLPQNSCRGCGSQAVAASGSARKC